MWKRKKLKHSLISKYNLPLYHTVNKQNKKPPLSQSYNNENEFKLLLGTGIK